MSEQERGRKRAKAELNNNSNTVTVRLEEIAKLRTLLYNFLDANPNTKITPIDNVPFNRHAVIRNLDDVEFVVGYLEGLCE